MIEPGGAHPAPASPRPDDIVQASVNDPGFVLPEQTPAYTGRAKGRH